MSRSLPRSIAYYFILSLNAVAFAGLLSSYLAGSISPERFWPLAFAGLAYPVMLLVMLPFTVLWAIMGKWKLFAAHLIVILWRIDLVDAHIQFGRGGDPDPDRGMEVISYNVHLFSAFEEKGSPEALDSAIKNLISVRADVLCLQEFYSRSRKGGPNAKQQFESAFSRGLQIEGYNTRPGGKYVSGTALATATSYTMVNRGRLVATKSTGMRCTYADLLIGADTVRVYNVHLESIRIKNEDFEALNKALSLSEKDSLEHLESIVNKLRNAFITRAELADTLAAHIARCPYPLIVCGDFNDTPASYSYQTIAKGLKDSFREAGSGLGVTYARVPLFRIDNILYSPHFRASAHRVHRWPRSDHFAVQATLHLR